MKQPDDIDISHFRADRPWVVFSVAPAHRTYRLITLTYVIAGLCHLWLADAAQDSWLWGNLFFGAGLFLLLLRPAASAWVLCAVGKLLPLLFARDHLVQSVLLMLMATGGALFVGLHAYLSTWPTRFKHYATPYGEISAPLWAFFDLLRLLTIATYLLAALHKLNRDFFHPEVSCALHGLNRVLGYYGTGPVELPVLATVGLAISVIVLEAGIALLYLLGQRRLALTAAVIFHIPLTLTMAPAFAFIMLIGHAAFLRPADLEVFKAGLRRRGLLILCAAAAATALSLLVAETINDRTLIPREFLLWALLFWCVAARPFHPAAPAESLRPRPKVRLIAWSLAGLFFLHGLTPYLGLRYQHTGAMVSNLRIDEGCWNSLIFPEELRISDNYIRVDEVYFGAPGRIERYENIVLDQLWNGPMVRQMRKNWCRDEVRPFYMAGTFRGDHFVIEDLCAEELEWPFSRDGFFGVELFKEHMTFQRNLRRECPQACIH